MEEEGEADDEGALVFLAKEQQSLDHLLAKLHIFEVKWQRKRWQLGSWTEDPMP